MNIEAFPNWNKSDMVLYRFETGWVATEPGNKIQTEVNGYLLLNSDGNEASIYHLWGE
jgi:hypothetical protein